MKKFKAIICVLIGHSRIITKCWGYINCTRCGEQIGDSWSGSSSAEDKVILYHGCDTCREAAKGLTWKDRIFVPDPFDPVKVAETKAKIVKAESI